jgi:hypothetical protein
MNEELGADKGLRCNDCMVGGCSTPDLCQEERDDYARKYGARIPPTPAKLEGETPMNEPLDACCFKIACLDNARELVNLRHDVERLMATCTTETNRAERAESRCAACLPCPPSARLPRGRWSPF